MMLIKPTTLKSIFHKSPFGALVTTSNGHIEGYNTAFANMVGITATDLIGKNIGQLLGIEKDKHYLLEGFIEKNLGKVTDHYITLNNQTFDIQLTIQNIETENSELLCFYFLDWKTQIESNRLRKYFDNDLKNLTANIPSVVFRCRYERYRTVDFVSDTIVSLTGWTAEELITNQASPSSMMNKEDDYRVWSAVGNALANDTAYTVEYRITQKDGNTIWVSENGRIVTDDSGIPRWIVGVLTNNSDVKAQNAEFEGMVNALNRATAVIEFDVQGHVLRANKQFLDLFGYRLEEVVGHHHRIFCSKEQHESPDYVEFWERLRRGEVNTGEYLRIGKNDQEVWIQGTYNPIFDADGNPYKVMKFATDLSQRREMEKQLVIAKEKAEDATQARGAFLANMSHEIRTPMNAIIGFTEQMLKTKLDKQQEHFAGIVLNSSRSLLRLLNEILDMAKLEKGAVELEIRHFRFYDLIEQVIATYRVSADDKHIDLVLHKSDDTPEYVLSDSLRIQQILLNLVSNAIKFTPQGSVTLDVNYHEGQMIMKVIDTGIGMKQSYLKDIFSPFTQSDPSTKRQFGGTGLGTAISHQLIQLMQGTITVESELGVGSTFTVTLPMEVSSAEHLEVAGSENTVFDIPIMRILAVDDTSTSLELLQITLEEQGHELVLAHDGEEGLTIFKDNHEQKLSAFDMIITDIQMPKMSGFEMCQMIRAYEKSKKLSRVPVIALTANVLQEHQQLALEVGMSGFATKPLVPYQLFAQMAQALENSAISNEEQLKQLEKETDASVGKSRKAVKAFRETAQLTSSSASKKTDQTSVSESTVTTNTTIQPNNTNLSTNKLSTIKLSTTKFSTTATKPKPKSKPTAKTQADKGNGIGTGIGIGADTGTDIETDTDTSMDTEVEEIVDIAQIQASIQASDNNCVADTELVSEKEFAVVNEAQGLKLWKKPQVYRNAITKFIDDNQHLVSQMQAGVDNQDTEQLSKDIHKIRGSAGNLSLDYLHELCKQLESLLHHSKLSAITPHIQRIPKALADIEHWLHHQQNKPNNNAKAKQAINNQQEPKKPRMATDFDIRTAINKAKQDSDNHQLNNTELEAIIQSLPAEQADKLKQAVDNFDFAQITFCLETIEKSGDLAVDKVVDKSVK